MKKITLTVVGDGELFLPSHVPAGAEIRVDIGTDESDICDCDVVVVDATVSMKLVPIGSCPNCGVYGFEWHPTFEAYKCGRCGEERGREGVGL